MLTGSAASTLGRGVARMILFSLRGEPVLSTVVTRTRKDQRPRHLSRSGPLFQGTLRQSQRPALAFRHAAGAGAVGRPHHGAALPHSTGPFQALLYRQIASAQDAARLGPPG